MRTPRRSHGLLMAALGAATSAILAMAGPANATSTAASGHPSPPPQGPVKASTASGPSAATSNFEQVKLASGPDDMGEPMTMAILPNGDVLHDSRDGTVYYTTSDGVTTVAAKIPVYNHDEEGLQGMAIDPHFSQDRWVYVYYGPPLNTPSGDAPDFGTDADWAKWHGYNQLSRFKLTSDNVLDMTSEQKIMQVGPTDRGICCHVGGNIDFDNAGNLYLSTGGDTNPFASDGYAPIDDQPGRNPAYDARRSAANTNDLRGKLLRIHVHSDGSYTIPDGNLFPPGTPKTRPEIYAMGFRNPFRFTVDRKTGIVYLADYGPDAQSPNPNRGPENTVEYDRITKAGNFGWPLCVGNNTPYLHYDFATGVSGAPYDCAHPVNDSRWNTGLTDLPPAQPAWIWNHYAGNSQFPQLGGQGSPMGGPVYHYDPSLKSSAKFPASYDGQFFAYEFGGHWIKPIQMDNNGNIQQISTLTNGQDWAHLSEPIDADFGPDGSLYVLDYGSNWFGGSLDTGVYKINYAPGDKSPTANISATPTSGKAPLAVQFNGSGSTDPENDALTYAWDFNGDGTVDSTSASPSFTYSANGQYYARLTVTDPSGRTGTAAVHVTVGNTAPQVSFTAPPNGLTFSDGQVVNWHVNVTDPDGTPVDCSKVQVEYLLGHDQHAHDLSQATGCDGSFTLSTAGHTATDNFYGILTASYTDTSPTAGVPDLTTKTQIVLQPKHRQAEFYNTSSGVRASSATGAENTVISGNDGAWTEYDPYDLQGISQIAASVASSAAGGSIEVHADSPTGPLVSTITVPDTGGSLATVSAPVTDPGGTHSLYFVFGGQGSNSFTFDNFTVS